MNKSKLKITNTTCNPIFEDNFAYFNLDTNLHLNI